MAPLNYQQKIKKEETTQKLLDIFSKNEKEDNLHKEFSLYLSFLENSGYFGENGFFTYMPFGEKRDAKTGALLKKKGTKRGVPDFLIIFRRNENSFFCWVEVKTKKGKQTKEQKDFENKTKEQKNEKYFLIHNLNELIEIIENINKELK